MTKSLYLFAFSVLLFPLPAQATSTYLGKSISSNKQQTTHQQSISRTWELPSVELRLPTQTTQRHNRLTLGSIQQHSVAGVIVLMGLIYAALAAATTVGLVGNIVAFQKRRARMGWGIAGLILGTAVAITGGVFFQGSLALALPLVAASIACVGISAANVFFAIGSKRRYALLPFASPGKNGAVAGGFLFSGQF